MHLLCARYHSQHFAVNYIIRTTLIGIHYYDSPLQMWRPRHRDIS